MAGATRLAYSLAMSGDAPDLEALAKRFLDLWQDQVAASVADPALADWLARFLAAPGHIGPTAGPMAAPTSGMTPDAAAFADVFAAMARRSPAAAAPCGAGDDRVDQLAGRLAECEKRLAALERAAHGAGGKPRKRPGKRGA
jgi:hypothetical protein